jgi:putative addiction module killer protein
LTTPRVLATNGYDRWLRKLKIRDPQTAARIQVRVDRLVDGNPGDVRPVGDGLSELRIHHGAGYRVYFWRQGDVLLILLVGGDKSTQARDVSRAKAIVREWRNRGD